MIRLILIHSKIVFEKRLKGIGISLQFFKKRRDSGCCLGILVLDLREVEQNVAVNLETHNYT